MGQLAVTNEEFGILGKRVEHMEVSITQIVSRIDSVLSKMEAMERAKATRREALDKLLQTLSAEGAEGDAAGPEGEGEARGKIERLVQQELDGLDEGSAGAGSRPGSGSGSGSDGKGAVPGRAVTAASSSSHSKSTSNNV